MLLPSVIKTSNYSNNSFQIHLGQKVLAGHFRSVYEGNFILMTFYPTIGVKGPNGLNVNCYLIKTYLFLLFKIDGYIRPNFDYRTVNNICLCNFFVYYV